MNCQDISRIADTGNFSNLAETQRRAAEAHALTCRHCAPVWAAHARLSDLRIPAMPGELSARCRTLAAVPAQARGRTAFRRLTLVGGVVALAAAAAMLATRLLEPVASTVVVDSSPVPAAPPIDTHDAQVSLDTAATEAQPATQGEESKPAVLAVNPFTVQMLPLQSDVEDAPRKAAIEAVYAALVDGLRAVPGLTLVEPTTDGSEAPVSANYSLTLEGGAVSAAAAVKGDFFVSLEAQRLAPDGRMAGSFHTGMVGEMAPGCASPASMVCGGEITRGR